MPSRANAQCDICNRPGHTSLTDVAYRCRGCLRAHPRVDGETYLLDVVATLHASYRQVDYWIRNGYVAPRLQDLGSGHRRGVTAEEVAEIQAFDYLVAFGILPARVAEVLVELGDSSAAEFPGTGITITVARAGADDAERISA